MLQITDNVKQIYLQTWRMTAREWEGWKYKHNNDDICFSKCFFRNQIIWFWVKYNSTLDIELTFIVITIIRRQFTMHKYSILFAFYGKKQFILKRMTKCRENKTFVTGFYKLWHEKTNKQLSHCVISYSYQMYEMLDPHTTHQKVKSDSILSLFRRRTSPLISTYLSNMYV